MYLTWDEYLELGYAEIEQSEYNRLIRRASEIVDGITNHFYKTTDLSTDIQFRQDQFKKAVATQVEYFHEMGSVNTHGLNEPSTVTIGRTTVSAGSKGAQTAPQDALISPDVYFLLKDTGLLYAGL